MDLNFIKAADYVLFDVLGGYVDPQGMVWSDGVSQQQYEDWCAKNKSPHQPDVRSVSWTPTLKQIIAELYWIPNCRLLPPGFDYLFLDAAVCLGVTDAIIILQRTVGAPSTGVIDASTQIQLGKLRLPLSPDFVSLWIDEYEARFNEVVATHPPNEAKLLKFWPNRLQHARANALVLLSTIPGA